MRDFGNVMAGLKKIIQKKRYIEAYFLDQDCL